MIKIQVTIQRTNISINQMFATMRYANMEEKYAKILIQTFFLSIYSLIFVNMKHFLVGNYHCWQD